MLAAAHFIPFAASAFNALEEIKWRKVPEPAPAPTPLQNAAQVVEEGKNAIVAGAQNAKKAIVQAFSNVTGNPVVAEGTSTVTQPDAAKLTVTQSMKKASSSLLTDRDFWFTTLRIAVVTISLLTLAMRVAHVQEVRGSTWAVIYALIVITLSVTITQHLMKIMVTNICRKCGTNLGILLAVFLVCLAAGADLLIFESLK